MLPDVVPTVIEAYLNNHEVCEEDLLERFFGIIGYINVGALKQIIADSNTTCFYLTWFPAPDNQELFLTFSMPY